ncbi:MAG: hypothetical protein LC768_08500, partial [Acidobacteria bacterium]|nr:hypothetical protein [Acidobacteriota bacterium]
LSGLSITVFVLSDSRTRLDSFFQSHYFYWLKANLCLLKLIANQPAAFEKFLLLLINATVFQNTGQNI